MRAALVATVLSSAFTLTINAAHADSAKLGGAVSFTGSCHYSDFSAEKKSDGPCAEKVNELVYQDGFSSLQFTITDFAGKEMRKVAFIGPRWTPIDDTHSVMVIDQLVNTTVPIKQLKPVSLSGYCMSTIKAKGDLFDHPNLLTCEYNSQDGSHVFVLSDITNREGTSGM